jgi:hypothetical protein
MSIFDRFWNRLRGKEPDPTIGTQIGLAAGAVAVTDEAREGDSTDYGWSGDHMSGGSDSGGGSDLGGGGFDGGGGGGDSGGAGGV